MLIITNTIRTTFNVAVTYSGLQVLGVSESFLQKFPPEFKDGMSKRAVEILGDEPQETLEAGARRQIRKLPYSLNGYSIGMTHPENVHALIILTAKVLKDNKKSTNDDTETSHQSDLQKAKKALRRAL